MAEHLLAIRGPGLVACARCGAIFLAVDGLPTPAEDDAAKPCPLRPLPHRSEPALGALPFGPASAGFRRGKVDFRRSATGAWYWKAEELGWTAWTPVDRRLAWLSDPGNS